MLLLFQHDGQPYCSHCYLKSVCARGRCSVSLCLSQTHSHTHSHIYCLNVFPQRLLQQVTGDSVVLPHGQQPQPKSTNTGKQSCCETNIEQTLRLNLPFRSPRIELFIGCLNRDAMCVFGHALIIKGFICSKTKIKH